MPTFQAWNAQDRSSSPTSCVSNLLLSKVHVLRKVREQFPPISVHALRIHANPFLMHEAATVYSSNWRGRSIHGRSRKPMRKLSSLPPISVRARTFFCLRHQYQMIVSQSNFVGLGDTLAKLVQGRDIIGQAPAILRTLKATRLRRESEFQLGHPTSNEPTLL
jgi:hypothetical protein